MALIIAGIFSCKKKEDTVKQFRVTQMLYYYNNDTIPEFKVLFEYQNNKIAMMREYTYNTQSSQFIESYRYEVEYPDANSIVVTDSYLVTDTKAWEPRYKYEAVFSGGKITESIEYDYYSGNWVPYNKFNCTYANQNMSQVINYNYSNGNWVNDYKTENTFSGSKLTQSISYDYDAAWVQSWKDVVTYNGNIIDNITGYDFNGSTYDQEDKYVYEYTSNLISKITESYYYSGNWNVSTTSLYTYDSNKNLATEVRTNSYSTKVEYSYETGSGNWSQIRDVWDGDSYMMNHLFPNPTKGKKPGQNTRYLPKPDGAL